MFSAGAKIFGHVSHSTELVRMCLACQHFDFNSADWISDNLNVISSRYFRTMGKEFIFQFNRRSWGRNAWRTPKNVCVGGYGAPNSSRKQIKNKEVETLPAGSGGTENVPTVSWTGATNGEPWKLGWVCAVIDENKRWSANDHSNRNCLVSCEYHTTESRRGSLSLHNVKIVIFYLLLTGHIIWGKNQLQHCSF